MKNIGMKAFSKAMREKTEDALTPLINGQNWMFRLVR